MGLQKEIMTSYGVAATYHKIAITNVDWHNKKARFEVLSYLDKAARDSGKAHLGFSGYDYKDAQFDFDITGNIVEQGYFKLKALDVFQNATDL